VSESKLVVKPFEISKWKLMSAFGKVKADLGAAGVDGESVAAFEENLQGNLYKLWNRLSSGTYCPPPLRAVEIPKKTGGGSGSWVCPRSPHRARSSKSWPVSDSIVVTHPFHPLVGERLVVLFEKSRPGADRVLVCEGGPAGRVTLPVGWTDRGPGPLAHRLGADGLVALAVLVVALGHPPVAKQRKP